MVSHKVSNLNSQESSNGGSNEGSHESLNEDDHESYNESCAEGSGRIFDACREELWVIFNSIFEAPGQRPAAIGDFKAALELQKSILVPLDCVFGGRIFDAC